MRTTSLVFVLLVVASVRAQWTAIKLSDSGVTLGVGAGVQVGATYQVNHALIWQGSPQSGVDIHPAGYASSIAYGVDNGFQGGSAVLNGFNHAGLWNGTSASWTDLHPTHADGSEIVSLQNGWGVGNISFGNIRHAYAWHGTTTQIDLHPKNASSSIAMATHGGLHGGAVTVDGVTMACIFDTDPKNLTILNPTGAISSAVRAVHGDYQGGAVSLVPGLYRASLWYGTAESWVDLHPGPPNLSSHVNGAWDGIQVGRLGRDAAVWNHSASSFENLGEFLPISYDASEAFSVVRDGDTVVVGGRASQPLHLGSPFQAYIWVTRYESPEAFFLFRGVALAGGLTELAESDNLRLVVRPGIVFSTGEPPVQLVVEGTSIVAVPNSLGFTVESSVSFGGGTQTIQLFNFDTDSYETVDSRSTTTVDSTTNVSLRTFPERFVQEGTQKMRAKIMVKANGPVFAYPWQARIDLARFRLPG